MPCRFLQAFLFSKTESVGGERHKERIDETKREARRMGSARDTAEMPFIALGIDDHCLHPQILDSAPETTTLPMENGEVHSMLPASSSRDVHMRYLNERDVDEVKDLCTQIFPVSYPDYWYEEVTTGRHVWSMAATHNERIIGIIVADIKPLDRRNAEDQNLLPKCYPPNTPVCYMLSLGVHKAWRRRGVASLLLDQLLAYLQSGLGNATNVRCLYLHVLVTNEAAIGFYERRHFRRHACLRRYYYFNGQAYDGYTYALYLNGGQPPWTVTCHQHLRCRNPPTMLLTLADVAKRFPARYHEMTACYQSTVTFVSSPAVR